jgi:hypothetical protein
MEARPSSSRSSSSSSTNTLTGYKAPVAPKNIARLVKPTSLGAPININNNDEFKVPSLPDRQPTRRPLMMARPPNLALDAMSPDASSTSTPMSATPSRLKRLSLLARSPTFEMEHQPTPRTVVSPPPDENAIHASPLGRTRTNTDGSSSSTGTPRRSGMGIRSSISYSPAQNRTPMQDGFCGRGISFEGRRSVDSSEGRDLMGLSEDNEGEEEVKGETLTER